MVSESLNLSLKVYVRGVCKKKKRSKKQERVKALEDFAQHSWNITKKNILYKHFVHFSCSLETPRRKWVHCEQNIFCTRAMCRARSVRSDHSVPFGQNLKVWTSFESGGNRSPLPLLFYIVCFKCKQTPPPSYKYTPEYI